MVNKGLELIEAHLLFDVPLDRIEIAVHPQSVIHSMVEFVDGSTMAQVSPPDMRLPIALGMSWPERTPDAIPAVDWSKSHSWTFEPLQEDVFLGVKLARQAAKAGGTMPAVFNAANEIAVDAFHDGLISFVAIWQLIEDTMQAHEQSGDLNLDTVLAADSWAREHAGQLVKLSAR
jgi:1-deoxy-D-xylulose-5-phosphate reductoisomerase